MVLVGPDRLGPGTEGPPQVAGSGIQPSHGEAGRLRGPQQAACISALGTQSHTGHQSPLVRSPLAAKYRSPHHRFEVDGANAARDFLRANGIDEGLAGVVWDAIALHTTPEIPWHSAGRSHS